MDSSENRYRSESVQQMFHELGNPLPEQGRVPVVALGDTLHPHPEDTAANRQVPSLLTSWPIWSICLCGYSLRQEAARDAH
jgi:hypothetical protein